MRRHDDYRMVVDGHEMLQTSGMVAMTVGDEHIVDRLEVNAHLFGISDERIAGSRIEQDAVCVCL